MTNGPHTNEYDNLPRANSVVVHRNEFEHSHISGTVDHTSNNGKYAQFDDDAMIDFWKALDILFRRKWLILLTLMVGLAAAAVMVQSVTPLYKAKALVEVQNEESGILGSNATKPTLVVDAEHMETQLQLLQSRSLAERVAKKLNLASDVRYASPDLTTKQRLDQATDVIVENTRVIPQGRSRVIRIEVISPYSEETARIANAIVNNFIDSKLERKYDTTAHARNFITERLALAKEALAESERKLVEYADAENLFEINGGSGNSSLYTTSLIALNAELADAESARISAEQRFLESKVAMRSKDIIDNPQLQRLKETHAALNAEYQGNLGKYGPKFPEMLDLRARVEAISLDIQKQEASIISASEEGLASEFRSAAAREASLKQRVVELKNSVRDERNRKIEYTILEREVDTNRSQYEALLQRMKDVSIATGVGSSQVAVIDQALAPSVPFQPNIFRNVIQMLLLSLAIAIGLAFLLHYVDDTIKSPDEIKSKLGLPTIGVIPKVKKRANLIAQEFNDPRSAVSEAYFSARTALQFSSAGGTPNSLLLTSTKPGEGKTSCTLALGMAFARIGKNVLIIDADLRKPSFATDSETSVGLSGLLASNKNLIDQIISSPTAGLHLLPAGIVPPNPAELLSSSKLPALIAEAETMFDLILIDSPPVLSFTDAPILASIAEGTIVITQAGTMRTPAIIRMLGRLQTSNANILGTILTKFNPSQHAAYNDYYYKGFDSSGKKMSRRERKRREITMFENANSEQPVVPQEL